VMPNIRIVDFPARVVPALSREQRIVMSCLFHHKEYKLTVEEITIFTRLPGAAVLEAVSELRRRGNIPKQYDPLLYS